MFTCAKTLSAAMQPISAVPLDDRISQSVVEQSGKQGAFIHGYTYAGHSASAKLCGLSDTNAQRNGLILRSVGNRIAFSPPLMITKDEVKEMDSQVRRTLDNTHRQLQSL